MAVTTFGVIFLIALASLVLAALVAGIVVTVVVIVNNHKKDQ